MAEYKNINHLRVVDVPIHQIRKIEIVQLRGKTMGEWYSAQADKPKYMLNGSLWDSEGAIGTIWQGGKLVRNEGNGFGFGISKVGSFGFGDPWAVGWQDYITGYPGLVINGAATALEVDSYVQHARTKRAAIACAGQHLYLVTGEGLSLDGFREELAVFGAYHAINLDGGGSARLMVDGKAVNNPTDNRRCPNAIAIWTYDEKKEDDKMERKVFLGVGHGGKDPGASGGGLKEKDITLTMALACKAELEKHGIKVGMSRVKDEDDPLTEEIRECNAFDPEVAVDIHVTASGRN